MDTPLTPELERRASNRQNMADYLKAHENEWIAAEDLEEVGGRQAWRTRLSECRTKFGMFIENKQDRMMAQGVYWKEGGKLVVRVASFYRYRRQAPLGRDAGTPTEQDLFSSPDRPFAR